MQHTASSKGSSSSSRASRLANVPKRLWKSRAKSQTRAPASNTCSWMPEGNCRWRTSSGCRLTLQPTNLVTLTEAESTALRQLALTKLQAIGLRCKIEVPKEEVQVKAKRRPALLRKKAITTSFFEGRKESVADIPATGQVFGVPLQQCIETDQSNPNSPQSPVEIEKQLSEIVSFREARTDLLSPDNASESSLSSLADSPSEDKSDTKGSVDSLDERKHRRTAGPGVMGSSTQTDLTQASVPGLMVPNILSCSFRHLESYGLHTIGLFRVSSSKRRVRELREEFDKGKQMQLNNDHHPHDVAQLLKEYFRDLPEPLLTRDLYVPLVLTQRIFDRVKQLEALKNLLRLLPVPNRDTLWALLRFLSLVAENSVDRKTSTGQSVTGNKMNAHNLATVFGPNLLRLSQSERFVVEQMERVEERSDVILVVRNLIESVDKIFEVSAEDMDALYRRLLIEMPDALEIILWKRYYSAPETAEDIEALEQELLTPEEQLKDVLRQAPLRTKIPPNQASFTEKVHPLVLITTDDLSQTRPLTLAENQEGERTIPLHKAPPPNSPSPERKENVFSLDSPKSPTIKKSASNVFALLTGGSTKQTEPPLLGIKPMESQSSSEKVIVMQSTPGDQLQDELMIFLDPPPRKGKSLSRKLLFKKEKDAKSLKIQKSKSTSAVPEIRERESAHMYIPAVTVQTPDDLSTHLASKYSSSVESDAPIATSLLASEFPQPLPSALSHGQRRCSRHQSVRFQQDSRWKRCELISSEHIE